jgi:hypothetical protein
MLTEEFLGRVREHVGCRRGADGREERDEYVTREGAPALVESKRAREI